MKSTILCGLDFETNSVDTKTCRATEIGAVLFQPFNKMKVLGNIDHIIYEPDYPPQPEDIVKRVTPHLTDDVLKARGVRFAKVINNLLALFDQFGWPDFFMAHNAEFDKDVLQQEMIRHKEEICSTNPEEILQKLFSIPFICTIQDVPHDPHKKCRQLSHLAIDYKVKMDKRTLHKALDDVLLMLDVVKAMGFDWTEVIAQAKIPSVVVKARIPLPYGPKGDGGVGKDACKANGFRYEELGQVKIPKTWLKKIKEDQIQSESEKLGYPLILV